MMNWACGHLSFGRTPTTPYPCSHNPQIHKSWGYYIHNIFKCDFGSTGKANITEDGEKCV